MITPEGFPLAYEVMEGNTADRTTLRGFLEKIESNYGKARRVWVMDRGNSHRRGAEGDAHLGPRNLLPGGDAPQQGPTI